MSPRLRRCLEAHGINETHISAVLLFDARSYVSMKTEHSCSDVSSLRDVCDREALFVLRMDEMLRISVV